MPITPKPIQSNFSTLLIPPDHMEDLENKKTGDSRELFPPENDFQNSFTKSFPKKHLDFGDWRHEIQT